MITDTTKDDAEMLADLIRQSFADVAAAFGVDKSNCPSHPSNCKSEWIVRDFHGEKVYFALRADGNPIGCFAMQFAVNGGCEVSRLCVLPQFRGKGYGRELMEYAFQRAKSHGALEITLSIIAAHKALEKWYEGFGFHSIETKSFDHLPFDVTYMKTSLKTKVHASQQGGQPDAFDVGHQA